MTFQRPIYNLQKLENENQLRWVFFGYCYHQKWSDYGVSTVICHYDDKMETAMGDPSVPKLYSHVGQLTFYTIL